jgi:hypothetical protein
MQIRPVGAGFFHADGQTDGHDEANTVVAFCNFANASENE